MKTSKIEVAAVSQAEAQDVAGALVRSTIPGTAEYEAYRVSLNQIHEMAMRLMGRKS